MLCVDWFLVEGIPDYIILVLGTNDLVSCHDTSAEALATQVVNLGKRFLEKGVPRVSIVEVLPRYGDKAFYRLPWMCTSDAQDWFFYQMLGFNSKVTWHVKSSPGLSYLRLKGLHTFVSQYLEDGLHLSLEGRQRFVKVLHKSAVVELKKSRPWRR